MKTLSFRRIFGSHMVLQRQKPIRFFGFGTPDRKICITFAGRSQSAVVTELGEWKAIFPPMEAGGPYKAELSYENGPCEQTIDDILIGEVWFCSGQSNMEMPIKEPSGNKFFQITDPEKEIATANFPQLRINNATLPQRLSADAPLEDCTTSSWQVCTGDAIRQLSACAYFFGKHLHLDWNIPVGIIAAAWGGTPIEAWLPLEENRRIMERPFYCSGEEGAANWRANIDSPMLKDFRDWIAWYENHGTWDTPDYAEPDFNDSDWAENSVSQGCVWNYIGRGAVRATIDIPAEAAGHGCTLTICGIVDTDRTYLNGQLIGVTDIYVPNYWSAMRQYTIPAGLLKPGKNLLALTIDNHYMSGGFTNPSSMSLKFADQAIPVTPVSLRSKEVFRLPDDAPVRPEPSVTLSDSLNTTNSPRVPGTLFNAYTYAWTFYTVRGFAWYQGCDNNGQIRYYQALKLLVDSMRRYWADPNMLFFIVQLASFQDHHPEVPYTPEEIEAFPVVEYPPFAITREIQYEVSRHMDNVATICTFDIGDAADIHPRDKDTIGKRMSLKAASMLGWTDAVADGPVPYRCVPVQNGMRIYYKNAGKGLKTTDGEPPKGFLIGDRNGNLHKADAEIDSPNSILVSLYQGLIPIERIRYAFCGYCAVNLVNSAGLPAVPFRTDKIDYESILY